MSPRHLQFEPHRSAWWRPVPASAARLYARSCAATPRVRAERAPGPFQKCPLDRISWFEQELHSPLAIPDTRLGPVRPRFTRNSHLSRIASTSLRNNGLACIYPELRGAPIFSLFLRPSMVRARFALDLQRGMVQSASGVYNGWEPSFRRSRAATSGNLRERALTLTWYGC